MSEIGEIALVFISLRNHIKIYHWSTKSYARHKASDKLLKQLNDQVDTFIEVMQGSRKKRIILPNAGNISLNNQSDSSIILMLTEFKKWLSLKLPTLLKSEETELLNIRDEMLASVNRTLYLFTLN